MYRIRSGRAGALLASTLAIIFSILVSPASATFTKMHNFSANYADGAYPVGAQALNGSTLYGFTNYGVSGLGSFYKQTTAGAVTTVVNFDGSGANVRTPNAGPVAGTVPNTFYATCLYGGANGYGMVFSITTGGTVTSLHDFNTGAGDGIYPYAGVIFASDGKLYGTAYQGGANGYGIIYSVNTNGTGFHVVHDFNASVDGYYPFTALCEGSDGMLYGSLYYAAGYGNGAVYRIDKAGTTLTVLHGFNGGDPIGNNPYCDMVQGPGTSKKLYGTCVFGGANGLGTIYSIDTTTGTVALVHAFDGVTGARPGNDYQTSPQFKMTRATTGTLMYGVTRTGGPSGCGTVFKLDTATNTVTPIVGLSIQIGDTAPSPLTLSGTSLYSTSYYGGVASTSNAAGNPDGWGCSFSCTTSGGAPKLLHSWYLRDGYNPYDAPTAPISNYVYGTTYYGGMYGAGTVYKTSTTGTFAYTVLHHFNDYARDGAYPIGGLYKAADGALYGATGGGGNYGYGTIYKITTSGTFAVLHHFRGNLEGYNAYQHLVQGAGTDKSLYGCCYQAGLAGYAQGCVYKLDTTGKNFTVLHYFTGPDGTYPGCQLTVEKDGSGNTAAVYGGTYQGGANGVGTLFKVVPKTAAFTKLHDFDGTNGAYVYYGGQMQLIGGVLYGVTYAGGSAGNGVIFKYVLATNTYSVVHHINNSAGDGYYPWGGMTADAAGAVLYGTCEGGGVGGYGTVWKYTIASDSFVVLKSFNGTGVGNDSGTPYGSIYDPVSGLIYGTTINGGTSNYGTLWSQTNVP